MQSKDEPAATPVSASTDQTLHPRLAADTHRLGRLERATLLLHRNAHVGWLILVPDSDAEDWALLDDAEHERISQQTRALAVFAQHWFSADRINVASIGNVVAQMHIHIVARRHNDACWPRPVWGHLPEPGPSYAPDARQALVEALVARLGLRAGEGS